MKGIRIIAVAFLASCTVNAANENLGQDQSNQTAVSFYCDNIPTKCPFPESTPCNKTTNLPHETDCTKFYKCFLGRPIVQCCPIYQTFPLLRLHYNRFKQVCDWPWLAGCESCPKCVDGRNPPSSLIPDKYNDCECYWECSPDGRSTMRRCPPGLCFSRTCQRCVARREGGFCNGNGCNDGDRREHPCDCFRYQICRGGRWMDINCEGGLHFNPRTLQCAMPDEVDCENRRRYDEEYVDTLDTK